MSDPSSAHKPMWLTTAEKRNVEMGPGGWVRKAGTAMTGSDNASGDPEILVAFRGSGSITGWISSFRWSSDTVYVQYEYSICLGILLVRMLISQVRLN